MLKKAGVPVHIHPFRHYTSRCLLSSERDVLPTGRGLLLTGAVASPSFRCCHSDPAQPGPPLDRSAKKTKFLSLAASFASAPRLKSQARLESEARITFPRPPSARTRLREDCKESRLRCMNSEGPALSLLPFPSALARGRPRRSPPAMGWNSQTTPSSIHSSMLSTTSPSQRACLPARKSPTPFTLLRDADNP